MKYLKDIAKIFVFVILVFIPPMWISSQSYIKSMDQLEAQKVSEIRNNIVSTTHQTLLKDDLLEACQRLSAEYLAKNLTSYIIKGKDNSCYQPTDLDQIPPINGYDKMQVFSIRNLPPMTFSKHMTGPYTWSVSVLTPQKTTFISSLKTKSGMWALIKDVLLVVYVVFAFVICGVLILSKSIQNRYRRKGGDPWWLKTLNKAFGWLQLDDIKVLNFATQSLIAKNEKLERDVDLLSTSLESSILNEIQNSAGSIPYTFNGTAAKVDINGFSTVVGTGGDNPTYQLTLNLEQYGCELLKRYQGLFEKTIGDEIVVVFKGENHQLRSLAFVRDLMREFSELNFEFGSEKRQFTLKSAISSSDLIFSKRLSGYGFSGDSLTLTTRLMDAVQDKSTNCTSILKAESANLKPLVNFPNQSVLHHFKNMTDQECYLIRDFKPLSEIYAQNPDDLKYYKSDRDLAFFLDHIPAETDEARLENTLLHLLSFQVETINTVIIEKWKNSLEQSLSENSSFLAFPKGLKYLSQLIMISINLIPKSLWTSDLTECVLNLPKKLDGRVNSSIIEVLIHFDFNQAAELNWSDFLLNSDPSFRTEANLVSIKAMHELNNSSIDQLIHMIKSPDSKKSKSGIYAACQVIDYYQQKNPAELELHTSYRKLRDLLLTIKNSKINLSARLKSQLELI